MEPGINVGSALRKQQVVDRRGEQFVKLTFTSIRHIQQLGCHLCGGRWARGWNFCCESVFSLCARLCTYAMFCVNRHR